MEPNNWMEEGGEILYNLSPYAKALSEGFNIKKVKSYHNNDVKHQANALKKRRNKNKNKKTHRK